VAAPRKPGDCVLSIPLQPEAGITVLKIGGSLALVPPALERVCAAVGRSSSEHRLVVVPGGGPFADAVRGLDARIGLSAGAAHWMAILGMDQYAHLLVDRIAQGVLVDEPGAIVDAAGDGKVAVLAPSRWMRSADVLPHTWEVTSDSIAAFVAGALGAVRLVLIKPPTLDGLVDSYFSRVLPADLPHVILSWDRIDELPSRLNG
jgi:5-(aminomethyl)-3-furanmethanol phosphate kinase